MDLDTQPSTSDVPQDLKHAANVQGDRVGSAVFAKLPDEIIELILRHASPNTFASLIILNRKWRMVSQQAHLYTHHLSQCPSYSAAHPRIALPQGDDNLPHLRRLFAYEIKRNLFDAFLRPRETIVNLVSTSIGSSSAPGGDAFHFSLSAKGQYALAYSSSRIHVLDINTPEVAVQRELKIFRRPAAATITDDGSLLAVLSTDMQVDLYDLTGEHPKHTRAVQLDHTPRTIALSPTGSVLAAAYDAGVEVSSLEPDCVNAERRAVKCYGVDTLAFSRDGTQLLGTTVQSRNPSTVVLTAPYYDPGGILPDEKSISSLWTTSILFPNGSRDCSHAVLLPSSSEEEASWTFTYDRAFETFRAVRIDDLRNGTTYFTGPTSDSMAKLLPSTLPAASEAGDLVVSGFQGSIWIYGVPEDLEALPQQNGLNGTIESGFSTPARAISRRNSAPSLHSSHRRRDSTARIPQWQLLCDKFRNTFVEGRKVATLDRVSAMTWVNGFSSSFHKERLVAVAPGIVGVGLESEDDAMNPTDGGRMSILDFDYSSNDGEKRSITIEVGNKEPEVLEEEHRDMATEVAIVRRRTVAQRRLSRAASHSATVTPHSNHPPVPPMPNIDSLGGQFGVSAGASIPAAIPRRLSQVVGSSDRSETGSIDEDHESLDDPYSQTGPRSGTTLRRAATAAAVHRRLHPRSVAQEHIEYRRADGREEHPHESDADNWVPPPPPYTKDPLPPLPDHIQRSIFAEATAASLQRANTHRAPSLDLFRSDGHSLQRSRTIGSVSSASGDTQRERFPFQRARSDSASRTVNTVSVNDSPVRQMASPVSPEYDDLYDVSPPGSPQPSPSRISRAASPIDEELSPEMSPVITPVNTPPVPVVSHTISRKPVGSNASSPPVSPPRTVEATVQQPVSPIPQPQTTSDTLDRRLLDWEATTVPSQPSDVETVPSPSTPSTEQMDERFTVRSNHEHRVSERLTELPPDILGLEMQQNVIERSSDNAPTVINAPPQDRHDDPIVVQDASTGPIPVEDTYTTVPTTNSNNFYQMNAPSAEQVARLNSRTSRPPAHLMTDPRRASAAYQQSPRAIPNHQRRVVSGYDAPTWGSFHQSVPSEQNFSLPRSAVGARMPPSRTSTYELQSSNYTQQYPQHQQAHIPYRRISLTAPHNPRPIPTQSTPNLRPVAQRLDTIQSQTSVGEPGVWLPAPRAASINIARNPSRAERSAAKNVKDAKKRGWRSKRSDKKKDKYNDNESSAGWTDVSDMRMADRARKEKTSGKCAVM